MLLVFMKLHRETVRRFDSKERLDEVRDGAADRRRLVLALLLAEMCVTGQVVGTYRFRVSPAFSVVRLWLGCLQFN
jgi:hypothetical protein